LPKVILVSSATKRHSGAFYETFKINNSLFVCLICGLKYPVEICRSLKKTVSLSYYKTKNQDIKLYLSMAMKNCNENTCEKNCIAGYAQFLEALSSFYRYIHNLILN